MQFSSDLTLILLKKQDVETLYLTIWKKQKLDENTFGQTKIRLVWHSNREMNKFGSRSRTFFYSYAATIKVFFYKPFSRRTNEIF